MTTARASRLADHAQLGAFVEQLRADARTFANQHERIHFRESARQLPETTHRVIEDLHLMVIEQMEAIELPYGILVVIENGDFHGH
jgi:hypothetical protein